MQKAVFNIFTILTVILLSVITIGCTEPPLEENYDNETWENNYFWIFKHIQNYKIEYKYWGALSISDMAEIKIGDRIHIKDVTTGRVNHYTMESKYGGGTRFHEVQFNYERAKHHYNHPLEFIETVNYLGRIQNKYRKMMTNYIKEKDYIAEEYFIDQEYDIPLKYISYRNDGVISNLFEATYFSTDIKKFEF